MKSLFGFKSMMFLSAMFIATCAAIFSVSGIGKLFAGSSMAVIIMALSLEIGKIVSVSFLYRYWEVINRTMKSYLLTSSVVLMLITSIGIYGFLSSAYQETADKLSIMDQQVSVLNLRKNRYEEQLQLYIQDRDRIGSTIQELNKGLSNNVIQYRDSASGQIITTTSSATRNALQRQLQSSAEERVATTGKIEALSDSITSLDVQVINVSVGSDLAAEVGPLRFVSGLTGWEMNSIVNLFTIMIVLVFDPLAIALIVGFNFLHKRDNEKKDLITEAPQMETQEAVSGIESPAPVTERPPPIETPRNSHPEHRDRQYFTRGGFDWSNRSLWDDNPHAVRYYERYIKNG